MQTINSKRLASLVKKYNVPIKYSLGDAPGVEDFLAIDSLLFEYSQKYSGMIVLYGGQTARKEFYGLTDMRCHTGDIEFYCSSDDVLESIIASEEVFYHENYDIIYLYKKNINITFAYSHIHDLLISNDFLKRTKSLDFNGDKILCFSPEDLILFKMRRIYQQIFSKKRPFGKDGIDIINMIAAPFFREELFSINYQVLKSLVNSYIVSDRIIINEIVSFILKYIDQLPKRYRNVFSGQIPQIKKIFYFS